LAPEALISPTIFINYLYFAIEARISFLLQCAVVSFLPDDPALFGHLALDPIQQ
jgi:hypothetical protein